MKTTLLILFLMCAGLWAQTPPGIDTNDPATRTEILRQRLREAIAASRTNAPATPAPDATPPAQQPPAIDFSPAPTPSPVPRPGLPRPSAIAPNTIPSSGVHLVQPAATPSAPAVPQGNVAAPVNPAIPAAPTAATPPVVGAVAPDARPAAPAAPREEVHPEGFINFPAVELNVVLDLYAKLVGKTILRPTALPAQLITLKSETPLTTKEAIQALDSVLALNGITVAPFGEKFLKVLPTTQFPTVAVPFDDSDATNLPEADTYVVKIVQLTNIKPSEMVPALTPFAQIPGNILAFDNSQMLIIRDYAANVKRMMELIRKIDVTAPLDFDMQVIPIKYALAADIASALGSVGGGTTASVGHNATSGTSRIGGTGTTGFGAQGGINSPGSSPFGSTSPFQNSTTASNPALGGNRTTSFADRIRQVVNRAASSGEFQILGQTKIIPDERTNSLLVFADKQDMAMISNIVSKLDVVLAQVLIEAIIMEVNLSDSKSLGVSYLQKKPSFAGGNNYFTGQGALNNNGFLNFGSFGGTGTNLATGLGSGFNYLGNLGGDWEATLTAAAMDDRINILSRPRIQTSHAVTASLQIGETVPYVSGTYFGGINGQASSQYQQTFIGINLQVTPLINPDGLVVMDIVQDIQGITGTTTIDGNSVPNTSKRTASAKVSVKDRDTVILGGFISSNKEKSKSGVPFLKDIPLLGLLFNSSSSSTRRTELMVLIRPTVLPTPEAAAALATGERRKSAVITGAEAEYRMDDLKSQKAAEKIKMPKE